MSWGSLGVEILGVPVRFMNSDVLNSSQIHTFAKFSVIITLNKLSQETLSLLSSPNWTLIMQIVFLNGRLWLLLGFLHSFPFLDLHFFGVSCWKTVFLWWHHVSLMSCIAVFLFKEAITSSLLTGLCVCVGALVGRDSQSRHPQHLLGRLSDGPQRG